MIVCARIAQLPSGEREARRAQARRSGVNGVALREQCEQVDGAEPFLLQLNKVCARVAQLDRAFGYEPKGREFESCHARHFKRAFGFFFYGKILTPDQGRSLYRLYYYLSYTSKIPRKTVRLVLFFCTPTDTVNLATRVFLLSAINVPFYFL